MRRTEVVIAACAQVLLFLAAMLVSRESDATMVCNPCGTGLPSCKTVCTEPATTAQVLTLPYYAQAGRDYRVRTTNLLSFLGTVPDTVAYMLNTATRTTEALDDDSGVSCGASGTYSAYASCATTQTATAAYTGLAVVAAYSADRFGVADIHVEWRTPGGAWQNVNSSTAFLFGGFTVTSTDIKVGDRLFVGVPPDGLSHDDYLNEMYVLPSSLTPCSGACGSYQRADATYLGLSRLTAADTATRRVVVGSAYADGRFVSARYFHSRLGSGWGSGSGYSDADGDGLTLELESLFSATNASLNVNTCASTTGPGTFCNTTSQRKLASRAGFDPKDSDNDGHRDDWELLGVVKGCDEAMAAPYHDYGACQDVTWSSTAGYATVAPAPLSALDADPLEVDSFVQLDYQAGGNWPTSTSLALVKRIFEEEGLECPFTTSMSCYTIGGQDHYRVRLHLIQGAEVPAQKWHWFMASTWPVHDYFNYPYAFYSWRRASGVFLYGQLTQTRGWARAVLREFHAFGRQAEPDSNELARLLAHETAHLLGLAHGGVDGQNNKIHYPSLMNYAFDFNGMASKLTAGSDLWPDDYGTACGSGSPCANGGACVSGSCVVNCQNSQTRFSRGLNVVFPLQGGGTSAVLNEPTFFESVGGMTGVAANVDCYRSKDGATTVVGRTTYVPGCTGTPTTACGLDVNGGGWNSVLAQNANGDPDATDSNLVDANDWLVMYNTAKNRIHPGGDSGSQEKRFKARFRLYSSHFDEVQANNYGILPLSVTATGVATSGSSNGDFGNSLDFSGVCGSGCTPDNVKVASSVYLDTMSTSYDGVVPHGFRVDAYVYLNSVTDGALHEIARSNVFDVYAHGTGASATVYANFFNGVTWVGVTATGTAVPSNTWYWVSVVWNRTTGRARLMLAPAKASGGWDYTTTGGAPGKASCAKVQVNPQAYANVGDVTFGFDPVTPSYALNGRLDEAMLTNFSGCLVTTDGFSDIVDALGPACADGGAKCNDEGL